MLSLREPCAFPVIEVHALGKENRIVDYSVIRTYVDEDTYKNWFRNNPKKYDRFVCKKHFIFVLISGFEI
ncbi:MAG: hypothetical protein QS748_02325 [Candidatus Endonucleobacter bathymodioli]|uniref:Uncharacterized protein n=1 Tax=Candidatus Endonucleibacter bathymodioli TaxID=539814 RepID=A0AA90SS68_9GAMM|nr:hypothetical protein [Candidatus Endonucleobacter bathymodioli]